MQDVSQDIQAGLYNDCGDPNANWDAWKKRCCEILSERGIINVMDERDFISADPITSPDCGYIKSARLIGKKV